MSISQMTSVWKLQGLSGTQKLVLLSLADNANDQGECYPSIATIVARTCLSERTVQATIRALAELHLLRSLARLGTSTVYMLTLPSDAPTEATPRKRRTPAIVAPPAGNAPPADPAPPAESAPPQEPHPAPAADAPPPPQTSHPGGAAPAPKPSFNRQGNRQGTIKGAGAPGFDLPDWLPEEAWAMYDRFRRSKDSKGWTEDARRLAVKRLEKLRDDGNAPVLVVEQAILRGWTGLFPLKGEFLERQKQAGGGVYEQSMEAAAEARSMIFGDGNGDD